MNDKYLDYQLEDFLEDDEFIKEVKSKIIDRKSFESWISMHPEKKELIEQVFLLLNILKFEKQTLTPDQINSIWKRIDDKSKVHKVKSNKPVYRSIGITAIAASILFILYFGIGLVFPKTSISTARSEQVNFELPDNSKVMLNAASIISFNKRKWEEKRVVDLSGEAFFNVNKGEEFLVQSTLGQIRVLGTSFNVFSRADKLIVECKTGKVEVTPVNADPEVLEKGQGLSFNVENGFVLRYNIDREQNSDWTHGVFKYTRTPLIEVFQELERQFDLQFTFESTINPAQKSYTGRFNNSNLKKALQDVCWPMHLEYEIRGKIVMIKSSR